MTGILLVDDHPVMRLGLKTLIDKQQDMTVVGEADNGRDVITLATRLKPDVILLDIELPQGDGVQVTRRLRRALPNILIVAYTMHNDESTMWEMLNAGASGYLLKTSPEEAALHAVRTVVSGQRYIDPTLVDRLLEADRRKIARGALQDSREPALTPREMAVLQLTVEGHTNKEIAQQLGLSVKTVETYQAHLKTKLGLKTRAEIVRYARRNGLMKEE